MDEISNLSQHLVKQWEQGEEDAATRIFDRYVGRLVRLVQTRVAERFRIRFDPEDVVQSAFREFFAKATRREFVVQRSGALWSILAAITINKLKGHLEFHQAKQRSPDRELAATDETLSGAVAIDREPSPEEALALLDELEQFMTKLKPRHREMLALRLEGLSIENIAARVDRAEATVQQVLRDAERQLRKRLDSML